jgi:hypothetical protein
VEALRRADDLQREVGSEMPDDGARVGGERQRCAVVTPYALLSDGEPRRHRSRIAGLFS